MTSDDRRLHLARADSITASVSEAAVLAIAKLAALFSLERNIL